MPELDTSNVSFPELLAWVKSDPKNPLAQTLVTNYELDTVHKSAMLEDARAMMAEQRNLANLTPAQIARHMIHFDAEGNPKMPEPATRSDDPLSSADSDEVGDDGIRLHSDNVTHIHHGSNGMTSGKIAAIGGGVAAAAVLAGTITWALMKNGPAKVPPQPSPQAPSTAPGLFEKDPNP